MWVRIPRGREPAWAPVAGSSVCSRSWPSPSPQGVRHLLAVDRRSHNRTADDDAGRSTASWSGSAALTKHTQCPTSHGVPAGTGRCGRREAGATSGATGSSFWRCRSGGSTPTRPRPSNPVQYQTGLPGLRRRPINGGLRGRTRRRAGRGLSQLPADPRAVHRRHQGSVVNPGFSPEGRSRVADPGWRPPASANRRSSSAHRSVPPRTRC